MSQMSKDDFLVEMKRLKQERTNREQLLSTLIQRYKAESGSMIPILVFHAESYGGIAVVQIFGDEARISRFTDIGPMGHYDVKNLKELAEELWMGSYKIVDDSSAAETLEAWMSRPKWTEGLRAMQVAATANTLYYHGYSDQSNDVRRLRDPALGYQYCKQFNLKVY